MASSCREATGSTSELDHIPRARRKEDDVPDTETARPAPPEVQAFMDRVRPTLQSHREEPYAEFKATLYLKRNRQYTVKVTVVLRKWIKFSSKCMHAGLCW